MVATMRISDDFELNDDIVYLNHAAVAPWPRRTRDAVCRFAEQNMRTGARFYGDWLETETRLRQRLQRLVNAPNVDDIALLKNTSEGLSVVAHGLEWRPGDNVVINDQEFPSNRIPWQSLRSRGVEVRDISLSAQSEPESALAEAMDGNTRLLSISSVQYGTGLRMDLRRLGEVCRQNGTLFCVDAIQSLGALPFDAQDVNADFVVADGHKWMLGPEGIAVFYCKAEVRDRVGLHQFGWHMVQHRGDYDRSDWTPARDAKRFECGSPNMLGIHGLDASLSLLEEIGLERIERAVLANSRHLLDSLSNLSGVQCITPAAPGRHAGIVTFRLRDGDNGGLHRELMSNGVVCAARYGGIRLSPHYYVNTHQLDRALGLVRDYLGRGSRQ